MNIITAEKFHEIYGKAFDDGVLGKKPAPPENNEEKQVYNIGYQDGQVAVKVNPGFIQVVTN